MQRGFFRLLMIVMCLALTACQTTQQNSRIIAKTFNLTTSLQQKLMDRYKPQQHIHIQSFIYQQQPKLSIDVYQIQDGQQSKRPTVVWIHGGGWIAGSKAHARGYFKRLVDASVNVVAVEYQFAPTHIYPTQLQQLNQALEFMQNYAQELDLNMNQLYLAGDSAGANLASHYAALLTNTAFAKASHFHPVIQPHQLKGLILHCGIYDLAAFVAKAPEEMKVVEWTVLNLVQAYTDNRKEDADFLSFISPIKHITAQYPPVLISGGNKDFLTDTQSLPMLEQLKKQNIIVVPVFYLESKSWLIHEYQFFMHKKESQQTFAKTLEFIEMTKSREIK